MGRTEVSSEYHQVIRENQHEIFIISFEEMDAIIKSNPNANKASVKNAWQAIKPLAEKGAGYYTASKDAFVLAKLISDLGGVTTKATVKFYSGKPHIILTGHPGLRKVLTGTRYGLQNPKVVAMGLGQANIVKASKTGGLISIVLLTTYRVTDYFLTDKQTLSYLIGHLATDVVKVGMSVGATLAVMTAVGGATLAIGPLAVAVVVGFGASMTLDYLDSHFQLTDKVVAGIEAISDSASYKLDKLASDVAAKTSALLNEAFDYAVTEARNIAVDLARNYVRRFLNPYH